MPKPGCEAGFGMRCITTLSVRSHFSRSAAELQQYPTKDKLLVVIEKYWQAERFWVTNLCAAARFREPGELADKLLLLVHGARNERKAFGYDGPRERLSQAGDDLMVAHGAARKPPFV